MSSNPASRRRLQALFTKWKPFPASVLRSSRGGAYGQFKRNTAFAAATGFLLLAMIGAAHAAGALAVGACGAYGYGYDFHKVADARTAAIKQCAGSSLQNRRFNPAGLCCLRHRCQTTLRLVWLGD